MTGARPAVLLEACVDTVDSAVAAGRAGASRLELCSGLAEGGTTPSPGLVAEVRARATVPVFVMIRPRGGDFTFNDAEVSVMLRDIVALRAAGADGIVGGALRPDGTIDGTITRRLIEAAHPLPFTVHRAFDFTPDPGAALDSLMELGAARVLTSGGAATAAEGAAALASLVRQAAGRIVLLAGGGVRAANAAELVRRTGVHEVHARPTRAVATAMTRAPAAIRLSATPPLELDPDAVRALVLALRAAVGA